MEFVGNDRSMACHVSEVTCTVHNKAKLQTKLNEFHSEQVKRDKKLAKYSKASFVLMFGSNESLTRYATRL